MLTIHHAAHTPPYAVKNGKRLAIRKACGERFVPFAQTGGTQ